MCICTNSLLELRGAWHRYVRMYLTCTAMMIGGASLSKATCAAMIERIGGASLYCARVSSTN